MFFAFWLIPSVTSAQTMCEFTIRNSLSGRGRKAAGVTVELALAIILAIVVLFFVLSIFGDNLKTMVGSSNMANVWDNSHKVTYSTQQYDPTQVNVQVLAEQGNTLNTLQDYIDAATDKINHYAANPPQNEDEVLDLAKWATIARITTGSTVLTPELTQSLITNNGIYIDYQYNLQTTVRTARINSNNLVINKQFSYELSVPTNTSTAGSQLEKAKTIVRVQYQPIPGT